MSELQRGRATADGTGEFRRRQIAAGAAAASFRALAAPTGDRWLSTVGLGTYLGGDDDATDALYREAIVRALELGANVLDSAINYRSQRSERMVGAALGDAIARGLVTREEVLLTTKGGFLPFDGQRPRNLAAYVEENYFKPGILKPGELVAGCHSLAPRYLENQLERSLRNLGVEHIDVYYLHNPETQLDDVSADEFRARMRGAFEVCERACADGKIGLYGTATWSGYRQPVGAPDRLDLEELAGLAREVGGEGHHFGMVQLPHNLAMPEAFTLENQNARGRAATLLAAAEAAGIYVMTSGSILQGKLAKQLPLELHEQLGAELATDAQRALQFTRSTPGVGTALVGMKRVAHVEENLRLLRVAPLDGETVRAMFQETGA